MSVWNLGRVWRQARYTGGKLLVLMAIADWSDDEGYCFPKVPKLAKAARMTDRTVQRAVRQLVADGALTIHTQSVGGRAPNTYRLGVTFLHPSFIGDMHECHPSGDIGDSAIRKDTGLEPIREEPSVGFLSGNGSQPLKPKPPTPQPVCPNCEGKGFRHLKQRPSWTIYCDCPAGDALREAEGKVKVMPGPLEHSLRRFRGPS